ncbi:MAG TPA: LD-carboxypeptidase [Moheibacter sp.]|nr:LD-carboxypeptidase [Moheibacter sp.]
MKSKFLRPKDKVAVIAPSGRIFEKDLEDNLQWLQSLDLEPVFGKNLFNDHYNGYHYAGNVEERTADLQWALDDDEIQAIWCARGGYGAVHLLDKINWEKFQRNPKWLIGYSDTTALHGHINAMGIGSIHGITVKKLNCDYTVESFESLEKALFGVPMKYEIAAHPLNRLGKIQGRLVGGNLSLLYSLVGSKSFDFQGETVLFVEDWNENWYHIDRMLTNFKRSGQLAKIKALLVGSFTRMDVAQENPDFHKSFDQTTQQIIHQMMQAYDIPMAFQFPAGHIGDNRALLLGTTVNLEITKNKVTLEFR